MSKNHDIEWSALEEFRERQQIMEWANGNSQHNPIDDVCCPDSSCCCELMKDAIPVESRRKYFAFYDAGNEEMCARMEFEYELEHVKRHAKEEFGADVNIQVIDLETLRQMQQN